MPVGNPLVYFPVVASLLDTTRLCAERALDMQVIAPVGCSIVTDARSAVVDEFLRGNGTHLFWLDSDICFQPKAFFRLLTLCTQVDVVGATYSLKQDPPRLMVRELGDRLDKFGLVEVSGLGLGFCCMKREVVERVAADKPPLISNGGTTPMKEVFRLGRTASGHRIGEDMGFFNDIRAAGFKVWLDPMVNVAHVGMKLYCGNVMDALTGGAK